MGPRATRDPDQLRSCLENQVFVAYCNHIGEERGLSYSGSRVITGPDGEDLVRAG